MNLTLKNTDYLESGVFGELLLEDGTHLCYTLQHAYDSGNGDGSYEPKVPCGTFTCTRGQHQLAHMSHPFETFEVMDVPGHTGILFHVGNFNSDSEGCILLGIYKALNYKPPAVLQSDFAFRSLMDLQKNNDSFALTVIKG